MVIAPLITAGINAAPPPIYLFKTLQIIPEICCRSFSAYRFRQAGCVLEIVRK